MSTWDIGQRVLLILAAGNRSALRGVVGEVAGPTPAERHAGIQTYGRDAIRLQMVLVHWDTGHRTWVDRVNLRPAPSMTR